MEKIRKLIQLLAVAVIIAAAAYLLREFLGDFKNQKLYDELKTEEMSSEYPGKRYSPIWELQKQNPDCIGIVEIPDTAIYYPVLYSKEEDGYFYVNRNFHKEPEGRGSIFMDHRCDYEKPSANLILYGHRMRNGQMFADLKRYKDKKYWQEHPYVYYTNERGTGAYRIFAVYLSYDPEVMDEYQNKYQMNFLDGTDEEKAEFVKAVKSWSFYNTGLTPEADSEFITLRTCDYAVDNGRISVVGYLESFEEAAESGQENEKETDSEE